MLKLFASSLAAVIAAAASLDAQILPPAPPYAQGQWEAPFNHTGGEPPPPSGCTLTSPIKPMFPGKPVGDDGMPAGGVFMALHMSLIPRGPNQGKLLIWGHTHYPTSNPQQETRPIYWAIMDPETQSFQNYMWCAVEGKGDLFCAGHSWDSDGNLLVAGGSMHHGNGGGAGSGWTGSVLLYVYDTSLVYSNPVTATTNPWVHALVDMRKPRWYPSINVLGNSLQGEPMLMISGGTNSGTGENNYEVWNESVPGPSGFGDHYSDPSQTPDSRLFPGPNAGPPPHNPWPFGFTDYPRAHLLSTGHVVTAGMPPGSDRIFHYPPSRSWEGDPTWIQRDASGAWLNRSYGSSVLLPIRISPPNFDHVLALGGARGVTVHDNAFRSYAAGTQAQRDWTATASMKHRRMFPNTVLLPDSSVLVVGGRKNNSTNGTTTDQAYGCTYEPVYEPELYEGGTWKYMSPTAIIRDYHSTALLLPSGKVMVGGGESREWEAASSNCIMQPQVPGQDPFVRNAISGPSDYQVYVPPCADFNPWRRPSIKNAAAQGNALPVAGGGSLVISYEGMPLDETIDRVVLMWPGSVTHHADNNQRCVELDFVTPVEPVPADGTGTVTVHIPTNTYLVPKGHYMLFLVTTEGAICKRAAWVQVQ